MSSSAKDWAFAILWLIRSFNVIFCQGLGICNSLADTGQFGEQHLEHWRWQGLLKDLEELLGLAAHRDRIGQMIHTLLIVSLSKEFLSQLDLLQEELLNGLGVFQVRQRGQ